MKKQKIKTLQLSKRLVSNLGNLHEIKGGGITDYNCDTSEIGCYSYNPGCLAPSGVSLCLVCMEEFTDGCDTTVTLC